MKKLTHTVSLSVEACRGFNWVCVCFRNKYPITAVRIIGGRDFKKINFRATSSVN